jgi:anti-sigma B factor antagonist
MVSGMDKIIGVEMAGEADSAVVAFKAPSVSNVDDIAAASAQIKQFIEENRPKKMIFDFEAVKFFSSQVLGMLLDIRAKLQPYDGEVLVSAIDPQLHRVFRITSLDKIFRFFPNRESAIKDA